MPEKKVIASTVPRQSEIEKRLPGAYFHDAWATYAAEPKLNALEQFLRVITQTPTWIECLMSIRNRIVSLMGLKHVGALSNIDHEKTADEYAIGDRVGIFTLLYKTDNEVLLGDQDRHLNVVVSVHQQDIAENQQTLVTVSTVVHVHNWLGRLYMLPVTPAHRMITRALLKTIGHKAKPTF